jgi:glycosyltransferase involved in cell wall biosynthesis
VQSRFLLEGLIGTGKYSFRVLGGAVKHDNYSTVVVNPDFIIKPVDGFGTREALRQLLITERPDAIFIFTDPRQFVWLWEVEDEIKQVCPICYWHVWDNDPYPHFNNVWYQSTELINCLSWKTYEMVKEHFPEKTNYIPHAFPKQVYFKLPEEETKDLRAKNFGDKADHFFALWVNRNATRKMPSDVLIAWKMFLDDLERDMGHRKAILVMHTDPNDPEGPNLFAVADMLGIGQNVFFSTGKIGFTDMNILHNITDCYVNIAKAEGFGLGTLESLQVGKPIIALKTGGEIRQVTDHRNGTELGVALEPVQRVLVGSQLVPFIYEDIADKRQVADAFMKIYLMTPEEKVALSEKAIDYVDSEFNYENMIANWDRTMEQTIVNWRQNKPSQWELLPLKNLAEPEDLVINQPKKNRK